MSKTTTGRSFRAAMLLGATCAVFAAPAYSQSDNSEEIEEIVTTGSRIARTELTSVSPINVLDQESDRICGLKQCCNNIE